MPKKLVLYNYEKFENELPEDAKILTTIISDYNKKIKECEIEIKAGNNR